MSSQQMQTGQLSAYDYSQDEYDQETHVDLEVINTLQNISNLKRSTMRSIMKFHRLSKTRTTVFAALKLVEQQIEVLENSGVMETLAEHLNESNQLNDDEGIQNNRAWNAINQGGQAWNPDHEGFPAEKAMAVHLHEGNNGGVPLNANNDNINAPVASGTGQDGLPARTSRPSRRGVPQVRLSNAEDREIWRVFEENASKPAGQKIPMAQVGDALAAQINARGRAVQVSGQALYSRYWRMKNHYKNARPPVEVVDDMDEMVGEGVK